jgi:hypothetical protein
VPNQRAFFGPRVFVLMSSDSWKIDVHRTDVQRESRGRKTNARPRRSTRSRRNERGEEARVRERETAGERKSARVCVRERKSEGEKKRTRENTRPWSGDREGHEGWCKGDGEAGGSASNEESQRLTKKKGRTLQFIDRPAVRAATRGKIKKKAPVRRGRRVGHRVVGGGERGAEGVAKNLRAKSAHEMKRNSEEEDRRVWGQARNLRTTGNRRRRPDRPFFCQDRQAIGVSITFFLFRIIPARGRETRDARILCDVARTACVSACVRACVHASGRAFAPPSESSRD